MVGDASSSYSDSPSSEELDSSSEELDSVGVEGDLAVPELPSSSFNLTTLFTGGFGPWLVPLYLLMAGFGGFGVLFLFVFVDGRDNFDVPNIGELMSTKLPK